LETRPTHRLLVTAFELPNLLKTPERLQELMSLTRTHREVFSADPGAAVTIALDLINSGAFDEANELLDLAYDIAQRIGVMNPSSEQIYVINKIQIKRHKGEVLNDAEVQQLCDIKKTSNSLVKMGACILLEEYDSAEECLETAIREKRADRPTIEKWPITKLLRAKRPIIDGEVPRKRGQAAKI